MGGDILTLGKLDLIGIRELSRSLREDRVGDGGTTENTFIEEQAADAIDALLLALPSEPRDVLGEAEKRLDEIDECHDRAASRHVVEEDAANAVMLNEICRCILAHAKTMLAIERSRQESEKTISRSEWTSQMCDYYAKIVKAGYPDLSPSADSSGIAWEGDKT